MLLAPVISEKSYGMIAERGKYTFRVHPDAHKTQIRQAVEKLFSVDVLDVNVITMPAKPKRRGMHVGLAARLEEGDRHDRRRTDHRRFRRGCRQWPYASSSRPRPAAGSCRCPTSSEITTVEPEKSLLAPVLEEGRPQQQRPDHDAPPGRRPQAPLPDHRLQARPRTACPPRSHSIEYDPNRSARIALLHYADGEKRYILAPLRLTVGATVESGPNVDIRPGNALPLASIPTGTTVHNVELRPGQGGKMVRSAGGSAQLVAKEGGMALLRLPSGEMRRVQATCRATIGQLGNVTHEIESGGKAGRSRWKGKRPTVRGTVMNPVDHPHGGGEGKNKGSHPVTPWGKPTLGFRTRNKKKASTNDIVRSRKRGKGNR